MSRRTWPLTARAARALIAAGMVATLLPMGPPAIAAEPSPSPSVTSAAGAGMCPGGHIVQTVGATPDATAQDTPAPSAEPQALPSPPRRDTPPGPLTDLGGTWSKLPRSPFAALSPVALWAGDQMVAIDPSSGRTATYDPSIHRWEEHQPIPGASEVPNGLFSGSSTTAWTGHEVILAGHRAEPVDLSSDVHLAFDPATGRWRTLADSPLTDTGSLAWTGELLVEVTRKRHAAAYDPAADCWLAMPDVPAPELRPEARTTPDSTWYVDTLHWTGEELVAEVRKPNPRRPFGPVAFDPRTWTWDPGPQAPLRSGSRAILADGRLLFMRRPPDARRLIIGTYDPALKTWTLANAACRLDGGFTVWTGRLLLEPYSRLAYDPSSGACYRIPKLADRTRSVNDFVWTGREVIVWSGAYGDADFAYRDGVVYRPPRRAITAEPAKPVGKQLGAPSRPGATMASTPTPLSCARSCATRTSPTAASTASP